MVKYFNGILDSFVQKNTEVNNDRIIKWSVVAYFSSPEPNTVHLEFICQVKSDDVGAFCDGETRLDTSLDVANAGIHIPFAIQVVDVKIGGAF